MQKMKRPRAALFFFDGFLSISPSVLGAATRLRDLGYDVDLFFNSPLIDVPLPDLSEDIVLHEYTPWTRRLTRPVVDALRQITLRRLSKTKADKAVRQRSARLRALARAFISAIEIPQFSLYCKRRVRPSDISIAFDMNSLAAMDFALPKSTPFAYWSLEITTTADARDFISRWLKRHELRRLNDAKAVAVQSDVRRFLFEKDLGTPLTNYVEIPNSPSNPMPTDLRRDFYSGRFPIPDGSVVVLHAGFISSSFMSLEIAQTVPSWPEKFVLVFHERQQRDPGEPYLQAVQQAGGDRTFLSLSPVPFDKVDQVYASASIGLVCYEPAEANLTTAWSSSGKLTYYLRHGLPVVVVCNDEPPFLKQWGCGAWTPTVGGIGVALEKILADYDKYSKSAHRAYDALFDFNRSFDRLMANFMKGQEVRGPTVRQAQQISHPHD